MRSNRELVLTRVESMKYITKSQYLFQYQTTETSLSKCPEHIFTRLDQQKSAQEGKYKLVEFNQIKSFHTQSTIRHPYIKLESTLYTNAIFLDLIKEFF
jgi:hypothetical protein